MGGDVDERITNDSYYVCSVKVPFKMQQRVQIPGKSIRKCVCVYVCMKCVCEVQVCVFA